MKKQILIVISLIIIILIVVVNFVVRNSHDKWVCNKGQWTRVGSPQTSQPKENCPGSEKVATMPEVPPESAALSFGRETANPENANTYRNSKYLSDVMKKKSDTTYSCLLSIPKKINVSKSSVKGKDAVVSIEQVFEKEKKNVLFNLTADKKEWKITNITCPK